MVRNTSKLNIKHAKACDCSSAHINCLNAKDWVKNQVAIWEFFYEKRDIRDKSIHPAVFPIALPKKCIELFTHKGELVLDPFVGIGTALIAAQDLERNAVGFDLNKKYVAKTKQIRNMRHNIKIEICNECGRDVSFWSGLFIDRVIDLDDYKTRRAMNKPFPRGNYICRACEERFNTFKIENNA